MKRFLLFLTSSYSFSNQTIINKLLVLLSFIDHVLVICRNLFRRFVLSFTSLKFNGINPLIKIQNSSSLAIFALVSSCLLANIAKSGEFKDLEKFHSWKIEQYNDSEISISTNGEIVHGDTLIFRLVKNKCDSVGQLFTIYTTSNHQQINNLKNKTLSITDNGIQLDAEVILVSQAMSGHIVTINMGHFKKEEIIRYYSAYERFQMSILDIHHLESIGIFKAKDFFDIPVNFWKTPHIDDALTIGQAYCEQLSNNLHAQYERIQL